jgi:nucleoside-diphosphate-sugar epimerase
VTGATGFVGSRLVRALRCSGARVHAFGRRAGRLDRSEFAVWDIAAGPLSAAPRVDAVVHCAGLATDWATREEFERCHVAGTRNVLATFTEPCAVVHLSTASVYDTRGAQAPLREDAPAAKRFLNEYCASKARAETLVAQRSRHAILRPHAIYGPGDRTLLPRVLAANIAGRQLAVGSGSNRISLTHVDNLVDALVLAVESLLRGGPGGMFNVADETPERLDTVLRALLAATGREPAIVYLPTWAAYACGALLEWLYSAVRAKHSPTLTRYRVVQIATDYTLDLERAKALLGYRPTRSVLRFLAAGDPTAS